MGEPRISASGAWTVGFPGAVVGMLMVGDVDNTGMNVELAAAKNQLENALRQQITSRDDILDHPIMQAYAVYYKKFRKSYHVLLQVESVALKGRSIPDGNAVVVAMFMAELKNFLLTAGHDLDATQGPLILNISKGDETYIKMNGEQQTLKAGDMMISDNRGVLSDVIYGPDRRTRITEQTKNALFVVYAPPGVPQRAVHDHLRDIFAYIQLVSPSAQIMQIELISAVESG